VLEGILQSNEVQIDGLIQRVLTHRPSVVGVVGLAFKANTDDMRGSPYVKVAKALIGEGIKVRIYDPAVQPDRLIGSNKEQVQRALRHLERLLVRSVDDLSAADLIIINHPAVDAECVYGWLGKGIKVIDLVGLKGIDRQTRGYEGIYW
jgi:GDP-mannose 6-dehydrogenase